MIENESINAINFFKLWQNFIVCQIEKNPFWISDYESNTKWTEFILGSKKSEEQNSPLGKHIADNMDLRYRKEDGLTDLAFASKQSFSKILSLHENKENQNEILTNNIFYPTYYEILVEHENNVYLCYEEMAKLTYSRAKLKVLITYNENDDGDGYDYINDLLRENFLNIITQSNKNYPENKQTEYLLVIGQLKNNKLLWTHYIFPDLKK